MQSGPRNWFHYIFAAAATAGILDILYAITFWNFKSHVPATRVLQSVASGLLGKTSFAGGASTAALGLLLHFLIALIIALVYYGLARLWPTLQQQYLLCGAAYGVGVFLVMNYVVVPLSAASPSSKDPTWMVLSILMHAILIGIPIAFFTRLALAPTRAAYV